MYRKALGLLLTILLTAGASVWASDNQVLAELRFMAHNGAEKKAGVWVDGQYIGFVKELNGDKKMLLLPGKHEIVVRQAWYQDYVEQALLEPGEIHTIKLAMAKESHVATAGAAPELKNDATPPRAAGFLDEQLARHRGEVCGVGASSLALHTYLAHASSPRSLWVARNSVFLIVPSVVFNIPATVRRRMPW